LSDRDAERLPQLLMRRRDLRGLPPAQSPQGFDLRRAEPADEEPLGELLRAVFGGDWTAESVRRALTRNANVDSVWVVCRDRVVAATASARLDAQAFPGAGYVHWVGVGLEWRRQGVGMAVCARVLQRFGEIGCEAAVLETDDHRLDAVSLYLRMGFEPVHRHERDADRWAAVLRGVHQPKEGRSVV
jgi:mycothiol synthase